MKKIIIGASQNPDKKRKKTARTLKRRIKQQDSMNPQEKKKLRDDLDEFFLDTIING